MGIPNHLVTRNINAAIIKVETTTPIVEKVMIAALSFFNCFTSICIAPANNKKANITFINAVLKSMVFIRSVIVINKPGCNQLVAITNKETTNDIIMIPMVAGNLIKRKLI